ncbi:putative AAA-type ATPase domain-containing protein [Helianthus anomalus]
MYSSSTESKMAMAKTVVSTIGSIAAASMVVRSVARDYLPPEFQDYLYYGFRNFINKLFRQLTVVIYEFDGIQENDIYNAATLYLGSRISTKTHRIKINKNTSDENVNIAMEIKDEFVDIFNGVKFKWSLVSKEQPTTKYHNYNNGGSTSRSEQRSLELTFHHKHKDLALNEYFPFILNDAKTRKIEEKTVKIFTVDTYQRSVWTSVNLDHPATFATLAMDIDVKERVMKDLDRFVERRGYYRKVGKACEEPRNQVWAGTCEQGLDLGERDAKRFLQNRKPLGSSQRWEGLSATTLRREDKYSFRERK